MQDINMQMYVRAFEGEFLKACFIFSAYFFFVIYNLGLCEVQIFTRFQTISTELTLSKNTCQLAIQHFF